MQHANLSRVEVVAELGELLPGQGRLTHMARRSARTEMALREVAKLQAQAARLASMIEANDDIADDGPNAGRPCTEASVRNIMQARLARNSCFPGDLFSDPAWDMLLDLYAAELGQFRVSVTGLCIASNAPTSTALRWINTLEQQKLIERHPDPLDGRRFFMSLTRDAVQRLERYFAAQGNRAVI